MAENSFQNTVEALFKGMDSFITTKTVVGDAITVGDTIILPLVDVSFEEVESANGKASAAAALFVISSVNKFVMINTAASNTWGP